MPQIEQKLRVWKRRHVAPVGLAKQAGTALQRAAEASNLDSEFGFNRRMTILRLRGDFDAMPEPCQATGKASYMSLFAADDRWVELGEHENAERWFHIKYVYKGIQ
jgi:hypothetical protein